jgi:hypothetical protein
MEEKCKRWPLSVQIGGTKEEMQGKITKIYTVGSTL